MESSTVTIWILPFEFPVDLGAADARQQVGDPARHQMRVVELGGDVDGELAGGERLGYQRRIRRGAGEIAAEPDEGLRRSVEHGADGADDVVAVLARGDEADLTLQGVEQGGGRLLVDAHSAVALHVGMAAHRAESSTGTADIAAQEHDVGHLADGGHRVFVLGHAHGPGADDLVGTEIDLGRDLDIGAGQAGLVLDRLPGGRLHDHAIGLMPLGMVAQEGAIEDGRPAGGERRVVGGEDRLGDAAEHRHVAARTRLVIMARHGCAGATQHLHGVLRIGETLQPALANGVVDHDAGAAGRRLAKVAEHARMVGTGVLADHEDRVRLLEILEQDGALADADGRL